jgi:hypothetical protein
MKPPLYPLPLLLLTTACAVTVAVPEQQPFRVGQIWSGRGVPYGSSQAETWNIPLASVRNPGSLVIFDSPMQSATGSFEGQPAAYFSGGVNYFAQQQFAFTGVATTLKSGKDRVCFLLDLPNTPTKRLEGYYWIGVFAGDQLSQLFRPNPSSKKLEPVPGAKLGTCTIEITS